MEQNVTITQLTLFITMILSLVTLAVPRKYILIPYVIGACWVPADQTLMVGELNFQVLRILVVVGIVRLWMRGEVTPIRWNRFDKFFLAWVIVGDLVYMAQWMTMGAVLFKCGKTLDALGLYWIFRQSIRSWTDLRTTCVAFAACALGMTPFVALEWASGSNPFGALGRVTTFIRLGNYRCQATFPHAIMMGLFWATIVPLFVGFARQGHKLLFWLAIGACVFMIMGTSSSTPILTLASVPVLLAAYRWRHNTRTAAWACVGLVVVLHIVMEAPVWHLLARVSVVSGSTGWHRFYLVDQTIRHFGEWVLLGTRGTAHWGRGLRDVTNQYVLEAVRGGLVTLILFVGMMIVGAKGFVRLSLSAGEEHHRYLAWCCFVCLLGHCISFLGVSYFGQIVLMLYLIMAAAGFCYDQMGEQARSLAQAPVAGKVRPAYP